MGNTVGKNLGTTTRPKEIRKPKFDSDTLLTNEVLQIMASATNFEEFLYAVLTQINRIIGEGSWKSEVVNSLKDLAIWHRDTIEIDPSETKPIDVLAMTDFTSINYYLTTTLNDKNITEQIGLVKANSKVDYNVYGKVGSGILYEKSPNVQAGNMVFNITNNDTSKIKVEMIRAVSGKP